MCKKKYKKIVLIIFAGILMVSWIYSFPLQRFFAQRKYQAYAKQQGFSAGDIKSKYVHKDYKQGGYYVTVEYYSDPDCLYDYQYFLIEYTKEKILVDTMYCSIYNTVYKPLLSDR